MTSSFDYFISKALDCRRVTTRFVSPMFCLLLCVTCRGFSGSVSTSSPLTPRETIKSWNFEDKTVNQVLTWYEFNTEVEKLLARATAAQAVSVARLQKVVRMKWGLDAETIIAHICLTDTRKDDDSATVTVENNRAIIQYNIPDCAPLLLVQINGVWRIDIASYVHDLGDQLQAGIQYCYRSSDVYAATADAVAADRYSSVKEAANALKKATDALEPGQSSEGAH